MFNLYVRKKEVVNTDPLNRCYDGCNFSEEVRWSEWKFVAPYRGAETAQSSLAIFQKVNPDRQYKIEEEE